MNCKSCGFESLDEAKFCPKCGVKLASNFAINQEFLKKPQSSKSKKNPIPYWVRIPLALVVVGFIISGASKSSNPNAQTETTNSAANTDIASQSWMPDGYIEVEKGFAYKRISPSQYSCDSTKCAKAYFVSRKGCSHSMDVSVNFFDTNGNIVDNGIDDTSVVPPLTPVMLTFDSTEMASDDYKVVRVSCFNTSDF